MLKETFLIKLKDKQPENFSKYDYSLLPNEFHILDKIEITCSNHKEFFQKATNHLSGQGCPICSEESRHLRKLGTSSDFINRAKKLKGDLFNYDKVEYKGTHHNVIITCLLHGDFHQRPSNHLSGAGCPKCKSIKLSLDRRSNNNEFIIKAKEIHGELYDYSKVDYINTHTKVIIGCPTHGDFLQKPTTHLSDKACPICKSSKGEKYVSEFLDKLNIQYIREYKISGYNYRYDFYLPEYDIYIEYHGKQHYESFGYLQGEFKLQRTMKNDEDKINLIKNSKGLLIVIKYTFKTKQQIEDELLRLFTIIHPLFLSNKILVKETIESSKLYMIKDGVVYGKKLLLR